MIIYSTDSQKQRWPRSDSHDPDSEKYYQIDYYPSARANSTPYTKGIDVVVFSSSNGCMYECVSGGISAASEPTATTVEGDTLTDGDVTWKCLPLTTKLGPGDAITASTWTGTTGTTLTGDGITDGISTYVKVTAVPSASSFELTNEYTITRSDGKIEVFNKTLVIPIREL